MLKKNPIHFFAYLLGLLKKPLNIFVICFSLIFINLFIEGYIYRLWRLSEHSKSLDKKTISLQKEIVTLKKKIKNSSDLNFIEMQARDRLDLVNEGDLVFVFSGSEE